jgi:hypothetical protein
VCTLGYALKEVGMQGVEQCIIRHAQRIPWLLGMGRENDGVEIR